jgi:hypothetical protein
LIETVLRNYSSFWFAWLENNKNNGCDYIMCGSDYQGYTKINLTKGQRNDKFLFWCPVEAWTIADDDILVLHGCIWAGPYELTLFDFRDPDADMTNERRGLQGLLSVDDDNIKLEVLADKSILCTRWHKSAPDAVDWSVLLRKLPDGTYEEEEEWESPRLIAENEEWKRRDEENARFVKAAKDACVVYAWFMRDLADLKPKLSVWGYSQHAKDKGETNEIEFNLQLKTTRVTWGNLAGRILGFDKSYDRTEAGWAELVADVRKNETQT